MKTLTNLVMNADIGKGVMNGSLAGVACGVIMIVLNQVTGAFPFENSLLHNLIAFSVGGALYGVLSGVIMSLLSGKLSFSDRVLAVAVSVSIWTLLRTIGAMLAGLDPLRFHSDTSQTVQGLVFSILLGLILGSIWKSEKKEHDLAS